MFPNQTPPAGAATNQTAAQATVTQGEANAAAAGAAVVAAANSAEQPETSPQPANPQPPPQPTEARVTARLQTHRAHPYQRAPAAHSSTNQPTRARVGVVRTSDESQRVLLSAIPLSLTDFFENLLQNTGLQRAVNPAEAQAEEAESVSSLTLSFSQTAIRECRDPALKRLLEIINKESNPRRRGSLILKAMRAFNSFGVLLHGTLTRLSDLLDINLSSVSFWTQEESAATAPGTSAGTTGAQAPLCMPVDVFNWTELVQYLQEINFLEQTAPQSHEGAQTQATSGATTATASMRGVSFARAFIERQTGELKKLLLSFNEGGGAQATPNIDRTVLFARIMCILQEARVVPAGTFDRVCVLLQTHPAGIRNWLRWFHQTGARQPVVAPAAPVLVLTPVAAPPTLTLVPNMPVLVMTPVRPQTLAASTTVTAPAASSAQERAPAAATPVFIAPAAPSTSTATELAPVLPPFEENAPEPIEDASQPLAAIDSELEFNMAMDEDEMLSLFDD